MYMVTVLGIIGILEKIKGRGRIAITTDGVILPNRPWKKGEAFFTYNSIKELSIRSVQKAKLLSIKTTGKTYLIASNRLSKPEEFEEITRILTERASV